MFQVLNFESRTLSWWYDQKENIDMSPPYQRRGHIWASREKQYLIDTILNNYDIPKFYLADFSFTNTKLNASDKQYAVIDGKQRLETIFEFFNNELPLKKGFEWSDEPGNELGGLYYKDLVSNYPKIARRFDNFNLSVMRVITDDEAKINELFVRLNSSKPLTGAELRNAMIGVVPQLIRSISDHAFFQNMIRFKTKRGQAANSAAKLLLVEFRGQLVETKKTKLDRFVAEGNLAQANQDDFARAAKRVVAILNRVENIFVPNDPLLTSEGPVTVYYWLVREMPKTFDSVIRNFLVDFDAKRHANRLLAKRGSPDVDPELVLYDNFDRSTNDPGSLDGRYNILRQRLVSFRKNYKN